MNAKPYMTGPAPGGASCRGLTLLEILIAVLVTSIGLLGLAGLQTAAVRFNTSAYYRSQATSLAYDLADRMRANREAALDGDYDAIDIDDTPPACPVAAGVGSMAVIDAAAWQNALACALPLGTGDVTRADDLFTITVQWNESRGEDPDDDVADTFGETAFVFTTRL
jgi:type IV pilus assembly protein PilV